MQFLILLLLICIATCIDLIYSIPTASSLSEVSDGYRKIFNAATGDQSVIDFNGLL
jgi:hypothetical protein